MDFKIYKKTKKIFLMYFHQKIKLLSNFKED